MEITVNVNINAPGLTTAIEKLADAIIRPTLNPVFREVMADGQTKPNSEQSKSEFSFKLQDAATSSETKPEPKQKPEPAPEPETAAPPVTLEQVRTKLAALAQAGKQAQVKELLQSFGATKLTDVPAEKYPELLAKAEEI